MQIGVADGPGRRVYFTVIGERMVQWQGELVLDGVVSTVLVGDTGLGGRVVLRGRRLR